MTDERWRRVKALFQAAMEMPPEERDVFLAAEAGVDSALRGEVESLMAADSSGGSFFDRLPLAGEAIVAVPIADASGTVQPAARPALRPGSRIGSFEIVGPLGAGAMGEVYRACDRKLHRDVALKVLPELFAADPDRLARFAREARLLATLNHQNIAAIYGIEESRSSTGSGQAAAPVLVLELVDGPTLAERLARGPLSRAEALTIARQIAEALEAAHEKGIIHRDLKPANIKIAGNEVVKVLDFGLAKVWDGAPQSDFSRSPTLTAVDTGERAIVGTPAYMSPEQARGQSLDKRTDIWSFGCVFYEMLTGRAPFAGDTISDTLASVLEREPDESVLPRDTPLPIRRLLRRCLAKDRRKRLDSAAAARLEIDDAIAAPAGESFALAAMPYFRRVTPWAIAALAGLIAIVLAVWIATYLRSGDAQMYSSLIDPPSDLLGAEGDRLALSPDGQHLAFVAAGANTQPMLWVRPLGSLTAKPLGGTEGANSPFWSPDSRQLAFSANGKLKRIDLVGGSAITLTDTDMHIRGAWSAEGVILFPRTAGLFSVSTTGGPPSLVLTMSQFAYYPSFLPDGRHFLFLSARTIYVASLDRPEPQRLIEDGGSATYAAGHLVFLRENTLYAQPFDPKRRTLSGNPFPVAERVQVNTGSGAGAFAVSHSGVLVYQASRAAPSQLVWFDRGGRRIGGLGEAGLYHPDPRLVADGSRAVISVIGTARDERDIWLFDVDRGVRTRITDDRADDSDALLSPDGASVVFSSRRGQRKGLYRKIINSVIAPESLLQEDDRNKMPLSFSPDGRHLLYARLGDRAGFDLWVLDLDQERKPIPFAQTASNEPHGAFSPDGRWVLYQSSESGRNEIYVSPFPATGAKTLVSTSGGQNPHWRGDGKEAYFLSGNSLMSASVELSGERVGIGGTQTLFQDHRFRRLGWSNPFAVSANGQRFLFNISSENGPDPVTLVVNWTAGLR